MPSGEFSDDPDEQSAATLLRDDQVDFLGPETGPQEYRDDLSDDMDEGNVFKYGDADDEEESIGLDKRPSHR